jgi:hypothetical protein
MVPEHRIEFQLLCDRTGVDEFDQIDVLGSTLYDEPGAFEAAMFEHRTCPGVHPIVEWEVCSEDYPKLPPRWFQATRLKWFGELN